MWRRNTNSTLPINNGWWESKQDGGSNMDSTRREFLKTSAKAVAGITAADHLRAWAVPERVLGANDRVRVAICGLHGRGEDHIRDYAALKDAEIAAVCDVDENVLRKRLARSGEDGHAEAQDLHRCPQAAGRQVDRRHLHRHAQPLALADGDLGAARPARMFTSKSPARTICGKASNWSAAAAQVQPHRAARHAEPLRSGAVMEAHAEDAGRTDRRCLSGARPLLQVARHHRPHAGGSRARRRQLRSLDRARARCSRSRATAFTTTGTGSGTTATAISATRASTRWTWRAGDWASRFPNKVSAIGGHFMFDDDQETPNTLNCAFRIRSCRTASAR